MAWTVDFLDTFTHYNVTTALVTSLGKWTSLNGASTAVTIAEDGLQGIGPQDLRRNLGTTQFGRIVGCRVFPNAFVNGNSGLLAILDNNGLAWSISRNETTGILSLFKPDGVQITSATAILAALQGYNLEMAALEDGTNWHWEVRVDGVQVADLTGSSASATQRATHTISPSRGGGSGVCQSTYAWMWSKTTSASAPGNIWSSADFLGNVRRGILRSEIDGLFPATAAGAKWIPNSGTNYYSRLNETLADTDTTYASTTADPNNAPDNTYRASWGMTDSSALVATVAHVQRCTTIRTPAGTSSVKLFTRDISDTNPANTTLDTAIAPSSSWSIVQKQEPTDPRGGSWSKAKLDSLERGIETQDLV